LWAAFGFWLVGRWAVGCWWWWGGGFVRVRQAGCVRRAAPGPHFGWRAV